MKNLKELFPGNKNLTLKNIQIHSKDVEEGDLFVCTQGLGVDRHEYIEEAVERGARALVVKKKGDYPIAHVLVDNPNAQLGPLAKKFYDDPLSKLKLIGITGTDGKTTTASILRNMIGNRKCGYIGTNGVSCCEISIDEVNTTPEIHKTYRYLNDFVQAKLEYATMEISSEALLHDRTNTLELDVAILTNITQDHLNVHKSMDNYIASKQKIFSLLKKEGVAILNRDDLYYEQIRSGIDQKVLTYGKNVASDFEIIDIREYDSGTIFTFGYEKELYKVISPMVGEFNVYNLSAAILSMISLGFSVNEAIESVCNIECVSGRCEFIEFGQPYKIVLDYAHTPNGLKSILSYLQKIKKNKIITVTGSAGGREKEKRKEMGEVVLTYSTTVIFTMDDPRYESVDEIIDDLVSGSVKGNYIRILNREEAIKKALLMADVDDIVLVVGKGRDSYMAIENQRVDYCDYDVIRKSILEKEQGI